MTSWEPLERRAVLSGLYMCLRNVVFLFVFLHVSLCKSRSLVLLQESMKASWRPGYVKKKKKKRGLCLDLFLCIHC